MLGLSKRADVSGFARQLAEQLRKRYPPALDTQPGKRPSVNRLTRIMEETCARAQEFQKEHRLGWIAKARLSNAFRWELTEQGYTKAFVDFATEAVVVHLAKGQVAAPSAKSADPS